MGRGRENRSGLDWTGRSIRSTGPIETPKSGVRSHESVTIDLLLHFRSADPGGVVAHLDHALASLAGALDVHDGQHARDHKGGALDRAHGRSARHQFADVSAAQVQMVLKDGEGEEATEPHHAQGEVERQDDVFVEEATRWARGRAVGEDRVKEEVRQGQDGHGAEGDEVDGAVGSDVGESVGAVPFRDCVRSL